MNENREQRVGLLVALANLPSHPESVPINQLVKVAGTPMADAADVDPFDFVRTVACARIMLPASYVRLSAGRESMSDELQALCFVAGANSIFYGEKLLTTGNPDTAADQSLLARLGMRLEGNHMTPNVPNDASKNIPATVLVETAGCC
jgi:biotin synthase